MISPSQLDLPTQGNTTYNHETNIHGLSEIQNRNPSNQAAEIQRLRPRGHWDLQVKKRLPLISSVVTSQT
jgi:hypothetical protein